MSCTRDIFRSKREGQGHRDGGVKGAYVGKDGEAYCYAEV